MMTSMIDKNFHTGSKIDILLGMILVLNISMIHAQVSISPGTWITVKEGASMMIGTDLHIKSIEESSGFFVDQTNNGDVTITGDILVERFMTPDEWHNVASPVSNETSDCFTGTELVFWYDETQIWNDWNFGWVWYDGATGGPLMVFRGYDVFFDADPVTINYSATGAETLNTGDYTSPVTITNPAPNPIEIPSHLGWNLAGNPYPSPVDWLASSGWDKSDINDAKYIWDGNLDLYTIFIGGGSPIGINGGTRFIPSNQGFWVQATTTGSIGIANSVRIGDMSGTPDFYKVQPPDYPLVSLVATGNNKHDEIIIRFIEGTTGGFDLNYDASKLFSFVEDVPQLSVKSGKNSLALSTVPALANGLAFSLTFQCGIPGNYSIDLANRTILADTISVYLLDELTSAVTNLSELRQYEFYHDPSYTGERFKLLFNPSEADLKRMGQDTYFSVYATGHIINIIRNNYDDLSGWIYIYNLMGQPVCEKILDNHQKSTLNVNVPTGYYIIYIVTNQYVYTKKILIIN